MTPDGHSKLRISFYALLFVAAAYAVIHVAFWSGEDSIIGKSVKPAGTGSSSSIPSDRP